jgi:thymidylate synthase (FAD)
MKIDIGNGGYVELLETFGSDLTVVNAARVSFNKESTEMTDRDAKLVKYLAEHEHTSPFFHPQLRFRLKMPIFVAREWFRHTIGFARNEVSRRYVDSEPEVWIPTDMRARDPNLKQGSKAENVEVNEAACEVYKKATDAAVYAYNSLLEAGVAPEMARGVLPLSLYTEFIETGSLAAYARLCGLRLDPSAQKEIQDFAKAIHDLVKDKFPVSWVHLSKP